MLSVKQGQLNTPERQLQEECSHLYLITVLHPKLACFDNEAFSLKLSFNLQFISATKVKVYIRPIMKKNKITAYIGGDAYSSTFESGYRNMLEECKMRDETVTYTYNNGIVKFKSSVLGNRSLKVSNNGKSLIEDKFAFNKIK